MPAKKTVKPNFTGSLADYKASVAKPKGIAEDIVGGIKNLTAPWQSTKPGELSQVTTTKAVIREGAKLLDQSLAGGMISAGAQGRGALAKQAGINLLAAGAGYGAGKAIQTAVNKSAPSIANILAKTNLSSELAPGQSLALHFSNNPNLKTIKDVTSLRNKGANFGTDFDSTQISPKGATYAYGPIDKNSSYSEVQGAIQEANNSKVRALMQGEKREYTLYATKANPLVKGKVGRIKDPEYGSSKLAGDQGQSIFGKQKVIAKTSLNYDAVEAATAKERALGKTASPYGNNPEYEAAKQATIQTSQRMVDDVYNSLFQNKNVLRAGASPHPLQNPASAYYFGTPAVARAKPPRIPTVSETIKNMVKNTPKTSAATSFFVANKFPRNK